MNKVSIYSDNIFKSEIQSFKATECNVTMSSRVIKAPVEKGTMSFDNKVIDPISIKIVGKIECVDESSTKDVERISEMIKNRNYEFYSLTTKDNAFDNLILQSSSSSQTHNEFDIVTYTLEFVEALFIQGSTQKTLDSSNINYTARGYINPVEQE